MATIPQERGPDYSLALLRDGYHFIGNRASQHNSDIFATRLLFQKAICMTGAEAVEAFYTPDRFTRVGAMPPTTLRLLQDLGSVQTLDGEPFRHRKQLFMSLMTEENLQRHVEIFSEQWDRALDQWTRQSQVVLLKAVREVLTRSVCEWMGIQLSDKEAKERAKELGAMVDGAGTAIPRTPQALMLRRRTEQWAQNLIEEVRLSQKPEDATTPLETFAWHRDENGRLLEREVAAVEVINVLRPTVAVDRYITFCAHALYAHPEVRESLRGADDSARRNFVQEVRRFYPFFPFIAGRVLEPFTFRDHEFEENDWVIVDLYGTNHDPREWEEPDKFRPDRFNTWNESPYNLVPQGGGDFHTDHRCPGEWLTIHLMMEATRRLVDTMEYTVPEQDMEFNMRHMPSRPKSGMIISRVQAVAGPDVTMSQ